MSLGARRRRPPTPGFVANDLWRRAGEVPSFHIAPARTRDARDLITGSVLGTYNSASPAWAVGPDGVLALPAANAPVIEYDPTTGACLGARIWGAVTNLFTYSSTFTDSIWSKNNVTITANSATSPAGTTDASLVSPLNSGNLQRNFSQTCAASTEGTYTFSIYVNRNTLTSSFIALRIRNQSATADVRSSWNTATLVFGVVGTLGGWTGFTSVEALPNGWFRLSLSVTTTASSHTSLRSEFWLGGYGSSLDTIGSPLVWGAQFQAGTLAPYVPTTTTTASSTADVWSITGADFSGIFNNTQGTIYANFARNVPTAATAYLFAANQVASAANRIDININAFQVVNPRTVVSGSAVSSIAAGTYTSNSNASIAYAYSVGDYATSLNGSSVIQDSTAGPLPSSLGEFYIGSLLGGSSFNGYIRELAIFRSRRPNTNLQAMTQ